MKNKSRYYIFTLMGVIMAGMATGCEKPVQQRKYTEIFIESQQSPPRDMNDPHAFLHMMPDDDIHANLSRGGAEMMGDPGLQRGLDQSVDRTPLQWTTPQGWTQQQGSGMRLATLMNNDKRAPVEISIISLGGTAGGLSANVARWMRQINLEVPPAKELEQFLQNQERLHTASGLEAILVDLTQRQGRLPANADSMIVGIIDREASQIFLKMTGSKRAVLRNRNTFKSMVTSLSIP